MGAAVGCCSGKATEVAELSNRPIERLSVGVGTDGQPTREVSTASSSSADSGRVSPTPSDVSLETTYDGNAGYREIPGAPVDKSSDYESSSGDVTKENIIVKTYKGNVKSSSRHKQVGRYEDDNKCNARHPNGTFSPNPEHTKLCNNNKRPLSTGMSQRRPVPKQPIHLPKSSTLNPGYVTGIGNTTSYGVPSLKYSAATQGSIRRKNDHRKDEHWGTGYKLDEDKVVSNKSSERPSSTALYKLDPAERASVTSATSGGFIGHRPLRASGSFSQTRTNDDIPRENPLLSVTGQRLNIHGQRQGSSRGVDGRGRFVPKQNEAFFLPMNSLVVDRDKEKPKHVSKRQKKTADAFVITFDGNGMSTIPLNDADEETAEDEVTEKESPANTVISDKNNVYHQHLQDYSYNLSRSNSRSTVNSEGIDGEEGGKRGRNEYSRRKEMAKNFNRQAKSQSKPSSTNAQPHSFGRSSQNIMAGIPLSRSGVAYDKDQRMHVGGPKDNTGRRLHSYRHPQLEIDALQQHINDLRQLLSIYMMSRGRSQQKNSTTSDKTSPIVSSTVPDGDAQCFHMDLIQKLQREIVGLENKLCEKEDEMDQLRNTQTEHGSEHTGHDFGLQVSPETSEMVTGTEEDNDMNYHQVLSEMDKEAAARLQRASKDGVSADDVAEILNDHLNRRDELRRNMEDKRIRLNEKMMQKLQERHGNKKAGRTDDKDIHEVDDEDNNNNSQWSNSKTDTSEDTSAKFTSSDTTSSNVNVIHQKTTPCAVDVTTNANGSTRGVVHHSHSSDELNDESVDKRTYLGGMERADESLMCGPRLRSNTFTKDDQPSTVKARKVESASHSGGEQVDMGHSQRSGTFTKVDDMVSIVDENQKTKESSTSTQMAVDGDSVTRNREIGTSWNDVHTSIREILHLADKAVEELEQEDASFIRNTWSERGDLDVREFQRLLSQHHLDRQKLQEVRRSDVNRRQRHLVERLKNRNESNLNIGQRNEIKELVEEIEGIYDDKKQVQVKPPKVQRLPQSEEELGNLVRPTETGDTDVLREELRQTKAQIKKLEKYILNLEQKRSLRTSTVAGTQVDHETQEQAIQTKTSQTIDAAMATTMDPVSVRQKEIHQPDVDEVLHEHRQRVHTLRQRKEEDGRVHQEKVQERLARRRGQQMIDLSVSQ